MERRRFLFGLAATATMPAAWSQNRPIRLLVPFAPGGATDVIAREIAMLMGKHLGATVVVENRGGAGGSIGTSEVARAAPDGYTLGLATQSTHAVNPVVYRKVGYDPLADFTLLGEIAQAPGILLVNAKVPAATLAQFVQHLRSHPDQLTYSSPGNGTIGHVWGELFKHSTGTTMLHVPYKGASQALADLVAGQVDSTFTSVASAMPYLRNGRVRALAVSWPRRLDMLPEVPTYAEAGWPDNNQPTWYGLVGPAGFSADARGALRAAMRAALDDPGLREKYRGQGVFPALGTPEQFAATIRRDMDSVAAIRRTAHISVD